MSRKQLKYIELDDEEGRLYAAEIPHLLFPVSIVELMRDILRKIAGDAAAEALMYRIGVAIGREYAKRIISVIGGTEVDLDKDAMLEQVYYTVMQSGWGMIELKQINLKDNEIKIRCRNLPCLEVGGCSCALERGITAGAYLEIVGERLYYILREKSKDAVTFDSLKEIPPELVSAEELALLSKTELEEVISEKTLELEKSRLATLNIAHDLDKAKRRLQESITELERFNRLAVGRELKMIELKKEINALLVQLGEEPRYKIVGEV
ncbi:MAG TPA: hypothetical protein EYP28_01285 [Methanophagales archaeon]|nr:hypothetical protein [Methanophagales archaeon]